VSQATGEIQGSSLIALVERGCPGHFYEDDRLPASETGAGTPIGSTRKDILVRNQWTADLCWRCVAWTSPLPDCAYSSFRIELDSNGSYPADDRGVEIREAARDGGE
jgi:hypothetical protein